MSYFITCPDCGANLDPGEYCDCKHSAVDNGAASNAFVYTNSRLRILISNANSGNIPDPVRTA